MASTNAQLGLTLVAHDQISATLKSVETHVGRLDKAFGSLGGRIKAGLQWSIVYGGIRQVERAIKGLIDAIPDLIHKGEDWAATVDDITDATGASVQAASELAGVQAILTGSADGLTRSLIQLAKNAQANAVDFAKYGIAIRDNNGQMLDGVEILQNIRQRFNDTGQSMLTTAAAAKFMGRGVGDLLDLVTLSNPEFAKYADQARRMGLVLTAAGAQAAEQWSRTRNLIGLAATGIGTQVLQGVAPTLIALTNNITTAIENNLANITQFISGAIVAVASFVSSMLGMDLGSLTLAVDKNVLSFREWRKSLGGADQAAQHTAEATDTATSAIQRQIDAIDRQLAAMDRSNAAADARREQQQLLSDIATAKAELDQIRGQTIFEAGMSAAEAELARQAQAASIVDGEKRVGDARQALARHNRDTEQTALRSRLEARRTALQAELTDEKAAAAAAVTANTTALGSMRDAYKAYVKARKDQIKELGKTINDGMRQTVEDAKAFGAEIADAIKDAIFGPDKTIDVAGMAVEIRSGGLVGVLQDVGTGLQNLGDFISDLLAGIDKLDAEINKGVEWFRSTLDKTLKDLQKSFDDVVTWIRNLLGIHEVKIGEPIKPPAGAPPYGSPEYMKWVQEHPGGFQPRPDYQRRYGRDEPRPNVGGGTGHLTKWLERDEAGGRLRIGPAPDTTKREAIDYVDVIRRAFGIGGTAGGPGGTRQTGSMSGFNLPGAGFSNVDSAAFERPFRDYLGSDSDVIRTMQDSISTQIAISVAITKLQISLAGLTGLTDRVKTVEDMVGTLDKVDAAHDLLLGKHSAAIADIRLDMWGPDGTSMILGGRIADIRTDMWGPGGTSEILGGRITGVGAALGESNRVHGLWEDNAEKVIGNHGDRITSLGTGLSESNRIHGLWEDGAEKLLGNHGDRITSLGTGLSESNRIHGLWEDTAGKLLGNHGDRITSLGDGIAESNRIHGLWEDNAEKVIGRHGDRLTNLGDGLAESNRIHGLWEDTAGKVIGNHGDRLDSLGAALGESNRVHGLWEDTAGKLLGNHSQRLEFVREVNANQNKRLARIEKEIFPYKPPNLLAEGGPYQSGKPRIVGERGPEWDIPAGSGRIVPMGMGGGNVTIQLDSFATRDFLQGRPVSSTTKPN